MVVYLDEAFLLNFLADALALYVTARVSGLAVRRGRLLGAAAIGGTYGALCALPALGALGGTLPALLAAAGLVYLAYGRQGTFLRQLLLFFLLSCTMCGAVVGAGQALRSGGAAFLQSLDWRVFFLAGGGCFLMLSVTFRGGARHATAGRLCRALVERNGRRASLTALLDTGHTLTDGLTGAPVLTVYCAALDALWTPGEREILSRLEREGPAACLSRLGAGFRLLPYRAVGVSGGLLLCFTADRVTIDGRELGSITVALSPTAVSGGGANALWGGEREARHAA